MNPTTSARITTDHTRQFQEEGYFILENAVPPEQLGILRESSDRLIQLMHEEMDRLGTDHIHISHRGRRYHIAKKYAEVPALRQYVFGDLMREICRATIGDQAYLFYDQYVIKAAEQGMSFSWHQDSGYLGFAHRPYVTCWAAVDDMTLENGTAFVMPFSSIGIRTLVEHVRDPNTGDKCGYFGHETGVPAIVPAGSVLVFSSLSFHRSGANTTDRMRRAYITQYSPEPINDPETGQPLHLAVPFLRDGKVVASLEFDPPE